MSKKLAPSDTQGHLTNAPEGAKLIAWHTKLDVASYRMPDGSEALFLGGKQVMVRMPTQLVVQLCRDKVKNAKSFVRRFYNIIL